MVEPVEINDPLLEMLIVPVVEMKADDPIVQAMYESLKGFGALAAVSEITFIQDVGDPLLYTFQVELKDMRLATLTMLFSGPEDRLPLAAVDIPVRWDWQALGIIVRRLANQLIDMRVNFGLESFRVVFA